MESTDWQDYTAGKQPGEHTVTGTLKVRREVWSPQLENRRDILVYLPDEYAHTTKAYPVIYMHDGQNLFDAHTSFVGEWCVDETLQALEKEGIMAIVVGIPNMGKARADEYSPFRDRHYGGGRGDAYLDFVTHTVKPLVDASFRTLPEREHTGLMGSSLGGLISLYGFFRHPQTYGFAGVMSPAFSMGGGAIHAYMQHRDYVPGVIYMDMGTAEGTLRRWQWLPWFFTRAVEAESRLMYERLLAMGYRPGENVVYIEEAGAEHNETAWARRLPGALRFLLRR